MAITQIDRPFRIKFDKLGADDLLLDSFSGYERVSTPFRYILKMVSPLANINLKDQLSKGAVLTLRLADNKERHVHGYVNRIRMLEKGEDGMIAYEAEVVPWLWFLTRYSDCRIFQNKSVPDILEQVFKDRGFKDYKLQLGGSYTPREYCVQYRETDFNFVARLMEDEGIFYFFEQAKDKHTMVLADQKSAFTACPNKAQARFLASTGSVQSEETVISLENEYRVHTGSAALTDYDFEKPTTSLLSTMSGDMKGQDYDYPGKYKTKNDGDRYTRIRVEEREVNLVTVRGTSNCMGFECGYTFKLTEFPIKALNQEYAFIALEHRGVNTSYQGNQVKPFEYHNRFEVIPSSVPFRPPRIARKPVIPSTQTAVVVGKSGEEIWVDKYGRIVVQFFWDRVGKADEKSSCWIRVAQGWAGKNWGSIFTPRIGQEVVVSFLEGDPDRPLVTGSVYNAQQMPPYALPGEQTKSVIKTNSSKGGGGFNELRFEDSKGKEQIFLNAERNLDLRVKKDFMETIVENKHLTVEKDCTTEIKGDQHLTVKGDLNEKVDGTVSLKAGMNQQIKVGQNYALDSGTEVHIKAGMNVVIESGTTLTLKVGGNFVNLNSGGVFIKGSMVMINSGGAAGSGSGASPTAPKSPTAADKAEAGSSGSPPQASPPPAPPVMSLSPAAATMRQAAKSGAPFCDI